MHEHRTDLFIIKTKKGWKIIKPKKGHVQKPLPTGTQDMPCMCQFSKKDQKKIKTIGKGLENNQDGGDCYSSDDETSGEGLLDNIISKGKQIKKNFEEKIQQGKKFVEHVIHGRHDAYPPDAKKILDENQGAKVEHVELRRKVLTEVYSGIMNLWTAGEIERRLKTQPKDKLFHISMWVKLSNGKTIKVEKNAVVHFEVNPKESKYEERQEVPSPPDVTFGEFLEKTRRDVGDKTFFSYSAKDNNCGNFIEFILKSNGMNTQATHDFIGQDTPKILEGFPSLRKTINTITDIAGRADVVAQGGELSVSDQIVGKGIKLKSPDSVMLGRTIHPAMVSDRFPRTPQSFAQVHMMRQVPIGGGLYASGGGMVPTQKPMPREYWSTHPMLRELLDERMGEEKMHARGFSKKQLNDIILHKNKVIEDLEEEAYAPLSKGGKLVKGSPEAKAHMARIRKKRMKGGRIPAPPSRSYVTDAALLG